MPSDDPATPTGDDHGGDDEEDALGIADDGMAPLINNTGADGAEDGDDADASTG